MWAQDTRSLWLSPCVWQWCCSCPDIVIGDWTSLMWRLIWIHLNVSITWMDPPPPLHQQHRNFEGEVSHTKCHSIASSWCPLLIFNYLLRKMNWKKIDKLKVYIQINIFEFVVGPDEEACCGSAVVIDLFNYLLCINCFIVQLSYSPVRGHYRWWATWGMNIFHLFHHQQLICTFPCASDCKSCRGKGVTLAATDCTYIIISRPDCGTVFIWLWQLRNALFNDGSEEIFSPDCELDKNRQVKMVNKRSLEIVVMVVSGCSTQYIDITLIFQTSTSHM